MIRLTTERLIICDLLPTDIDASAALYTNPVVRRYLGGVRSVDEALNGLRHSIEVENEYPFSVHLRATNEFIGLVSISPHHNPKDMEISYTFLPEYWGNGFARETIRALHGFCKQKLKLHRVVSETQTANDRSCRLLEKLGYKAERRIERFGAEQTIYVYKLSDDADDYELWAVLDKLAAESEIVIDRPKGSAHPRYPSFIYPLDYGYLKGTTAMDGGGIDVWRGSAPDRRIDAITCIVDLAKRDSEIKILIGCTDDEKAQVYRVHNETDMMKGILIRRA